MYKLYKPEEKIVDRAVELWKRMLKNPKFDNGDSSPTGFFAGAMAKMIPNNATDEVLQAFGEHLKNALMNIDPEYKSEYYHSYLSVDYGPDKVLHTAAEKAGLKMEFPWKTTMHLWTDHVSVSAGYGAESIYHYPLSDGRWLMTTLSGSDISKIIAYCEGQELAFEIEGQKV